MMMMMINNVSIIVPHVMHTYTCTTINHNSHIGSEQA